MTGSVPSVGELRGAIEAGRILNGPLPTPDAGARLASARGLLGEAAVRKDGYDALLVSDLNNVRALSGFTGSAARMIVWPDRVMLLTDGRYAERAAEEIAAAGVGSSIELVIRVTLADQLTYLTERAAGIARLGVEGANVTWNDVRSYQEAFTGTALVPTTDVLEPLRRVKTVEEATLLSRAAAIADRAFTDVVAAMAEGPTEREFASLLDDRMRALGADAVSFDTIVASGPNGSRPHHETSGRRIERGDLVICDFGTLVRGYHSDTTRTVCVGEPSEDQLHHLAVVRAAHRGGVAAVRPGVEGKAVDAACREVIAESGWASFFTTGTGHGFGLRIHEQPWLGVTSTSVLVHGDTTTVEPGVYLPGVAGARIEDSMLVTDEGPLLLTSLPDDLVVRA